MDDRKELDREYTLSLEDMEKLAADKLEVIE